MATYTVCDACGKACNHKNGFKVTICRMTELGHSAGSPEVKDVCQACKNKISKLLKGVSLT